MEDLPDSLTLHGLIEARAQALRLDEQGLARAMDLDGAEALRQILDRARRGDLTRMPLVLGDFARALDLPVSRLETALDVSREAVRRRWEARMRARFVPHAVFLTVNEVPRPVILAALLAAERHLRLDLPLGLPDGDRPGWVAGAAPRRIAGFGAVTGFWINHTPDHASRHALDGRGVETSGTLFHRVGTALPGGRAEAMAVDLPRRL